MKDFKQRIENTLVEYFDKLHEMGFDMKLEPFGKGYRLVVGNMHIYFENEQLTYTGWGMGFSGNGEGIPTTQQSLDKGDKDRVCDSPWHLAPQKFKNSYGTFVWECPLCGEKTTYPAERKYHDNK